MTLPVSICIPVRNESKNLAACLASLGDAFEEVVVVDSGSSDDTVALAKAGGATTLEFRWDGRFPKKRNWALRNHTWRSPWVLFLDADERVTPEFVAELKATLPGTTKVGFWIGFNDRFMGRPLHYGDVFRKLALFRIEAGEYEKFPEENWSDLDMEVHEHPELQGEIGAIKARLVHHDDRGLHNYIWRHNEYSTWESRRFLWLQKAGAAEWKKLTPRQRLKYRHLRKIWFAPAYFLAGYIFKGGFLDGAAGFYFALMKLRYFADIRLKIIEAQAAEFCGR